MADALIEEHDWHLERADAYETAEPGSAEYDAIRATVDSDRETRRQLKLKVRWSTRMPRQCSWHTAPHSHAHPDDESADDADDGHNARERRPSEAEAKHP